MASASEQNPVDGAALVLIPAGPFLAGSSDSDADAWDDERPQREVDLPTFRLYRTPVTNAQFARFVAAAAPSLEGNWIPSLAVECPDHPVTEVTQADALSYCAWAGVRLPTEWEWEKAARGLDGRRYPWGDAFREDLANTRESGRLTTVPVDAFPAAASPYGCLDMAGNTWDWTVSLLDGHAERVVVRGGSFW